MSNGLLILGDNIDTLRNRPDQSVDFIYLDPPFRSENLYRSTGTAGKSAGEAIFDDRWHWNEDLDSSLKKSIERLPDEAVRFTEAIEKAFQRDGRYAYVIFMMIRLAEMRRILKTSGSIALHCDQSASALLKLAMDSLFGQANYLNTIVWCYGLGGSSSRRYPRKHDDILWYSKEENQHYFLPPLEPASSQRMKGMNKKSPDFWLIPAINNMSHERTGFPTQKPLALLERLVAASTPPGGSIIDPFCGSGTTLIAASRQKRDWIGIDSAPQAIATTTSRLEKEGFERDFVLQR